ncbi:MAG: autotransporter-associated beta strand repeat-containing protein, partial [Verrucomicrobiota bacterium]
MKPRYSFRRILSFPALILAGSIATPCVQATSDSWSVDAAGNWATFGSWLSGTQAPGSTTTDNTDIATFNMLLTLAGKTVTVDTDRYIGGISFGNTSAFGYTLGTGILHLNSGGVIQTLSGNGNHTDTISSAIVISGTSGATATFTAGATSATSLLNIGAVTGSATSGNTTTLTLNGTNTGANLVSGIIGDGASAGKLALNKSGAGTWVLTGANTYTGATTLSAGGLTLGGASGALALSSTAISLAGGTFTLDNTGVGNNNTGRIDDTQAIRLGGGSLVYKGSDQASTNSTETVGAITQAGGNDAITVTFGGTNTATLTATSFIHTLGNASTLVNGTSLGKDTASTASVGRLMILGTAPTLVGTTAALGTGINSAV